MGATSLLFIARKQIMLKAIELDIGGFVASGGWATNFNRQNSMKVRRCVSESGDANKAFAELGMYGILLLLSKLGARPEDVLNVDKTRIILQHNLNTRLHPKA